MTKSVQWYGAHPSEGSVSMEVYREGLCRARRRGDPYQISVWPLEGTPTNAQPRLKRSLHKYVAYPARIARQCQGELVHFLDHSSGHLLPFVPKGKKRVVTLHDLIPLRYSDQLSQKQLRRFQRSVEHLRACDALIAVSEYSKREAVELLDLKEKQVVVIPNGVAPPPSTGIEQSAPVSSLRQAGAEVVLLSVGSTLGRKNLKILPSLLAKARARTTRKIALLRVGGTLDASLSNQLREIMGDDLFYEAGPLSEMELWSCYQHCDIVLVPSLYEGFGLPVLEALSCGKAVVSSNTTSLPEVGGNCAEYFDPHHPEEGAQALLRAIETIQDSSLSKARAVYASQFSWRNHLERTYQVYDRVLSTK